MRSRVRKFGAQRRPGAIIVLMIVMLVAALSLAFYAIDRASLQREHAYNQVISDLASRYGTNMTKRTDDTEKIQASIDAIVNENFQNRPNNSTDKSYSAEYGSVDAATLTFVPNSTPLNSVRVQVLTKLLTVGFNGRQAAALDVSRDATAVALHQDICVVVDRSSSMCFLDSKKGAYPDFAEGNAMLTSADPVARNRADEWWRYWAHPRVSRWARLIDALDAMAVEMEKTSQDEYFSIVTYSHRHRIRWWNQQGVRTLYTIPAAELEVPPTFDYVAAIEEFSRYYREDHIVYGYTNITAGIEEGRKLLTGPLSRENAYKTMIVLTDGRYNQGRFPGVSAKAAADQGIHIVTITFGAGSSPEVMKAVADMSGGQHYHAENGDELESVFRMIAHIPPLAYIE